METDSKESSSDDSVDENIIRWRIKKLKQEWQISNNKIKYLKDLIASVEASEIPPSDVKSAVSPIRSPVHEPQDLSKDSFEHLPNSPISIESLNQSEVIYDPNEALHQASIKDCNHISPRKTWDDEIQSARTGAKFKAPESFTGPGGSYVSKSKESANPKFRYKKGSKHVVQSVEASCQETAVKPFKEASGSSEKKDMEPQALKAEIRISPAKKRKLLDLDESCFTWISKLSENRADDKDDIKIPKKLKLHDDEKSRKRCLSRTALLSQKKYEGYDSSKYIYQSRTYQSRNESEQLPSSSNVKKVVGDLSTLFRGNNDFSCNERVESYLTIGGEDMAESKSKESTSTSVRIDEPLIAREEYSLKCASDSSEFFASDEASNSEES